MPNLPPTADSTADVASPCVRNCCLDEHDICLGCHRSIEEIMGWGNASNSQRRTILARAIERARQRRQQHPSNRKDR